MRNQYSVVPDAGTTMLAVHELRGPDEYVFMFAPSLKDRPQEVEASSDHTMHAWKRGKSWRAGVGRSMHRPMRTASTC